MVYPWVLQVPRVSHDTEFDSVVFTHTRARYGMLRYGYGVWKSDLWVTRVEPYLFIGFIIIGSLHIL